MNPLLRVIGLGVMGAAFLGAAAAAEKSPPGAKEYFVYFGTYTKGKSQGIYRAQLDVASGKLSPATLAAECHDPAFLAVHPQGKFLYMIDEGTDPAKTPGRGVRAYAIDSRTGGLTFLNEQSAGGAGPCHLAVDQQGSCVLVAHYSGGSVVALPLSPDGRVGPPGRLIQHTGASVNPARQKAPHAHAIVIAPDNRFALTPDLGLDKVMVHRLDAAKAALTPNTPPSAAVAPGSGPRHLVFHPNGTFAYVINEMLCTVTAFRYDARQGALQELQTVTTLPAGEAMQARYSTAEIAVHPGGKFLYGSNRGHDSIVVYAVDPATGRLTWVENQPTKGKTPRHFALDPTGRWLLAENQDSDTVVVFGIDATSGRLTATGQSLEVPMAVCAVFVPR